jgi:hypothetical protein
VLSFRKYLPSKKRAVQLAIGLLIVFLLGWWAQSRIKAASARRFVPAGELDRIEYAVGNARAWHVTTVGTLHEQPFQTDQDVVCPFQSHTITRAKDEGNAAASAGTLASEIIETRDTMYAREAGEPWHSEPKAGSNKCRMGPMAGPSPLISILAGLKGARLMRGATLQFGGNSCRAWSFLSSSSGALLATICVDDATHLPYELKMGALEAQYSNWNLPIVIEAPAVSGTP